ncbi:heterokaryon incompatibility [Fusarium albosuccineum]|uniref:Heterokaryon incompatibility n=1 Tax=Fusarium albosuccineum TaxID=1237068 RepID=A0A8H4PL50_9HYPO|nr:heterokaryon incompatibility [Fusarium albosuccineum]
MFFIAVERYLNQIDALCINQKDIAERGEQVTLMGAVYSQCTRCLIWLGADGDNTAKIAFETVDKVCQAAREAEEDSKNPLLEMFSMFSSLQLARSTFNESFAQRLKGERGESGFKLQDTQAELFALLGRPWFQRKWIFQEAVLAPESTLYCGDQTRPLSAILEAGYNLHRHRAWYHSREQFLIVRDLHLMSQYFSLDDARNRPVDPRTLVALLGFLRMKLSTDPKDAVFSVLGLVKQHETTKASFQSLLKADYTRSLTDVLASATKFAIIETQTLDVLRFIRPRVNEDEETSKIPSWVPRWHFRHESMGMGSNRISPNEEYLTQYVKKLDLLDPHDTKVLKCRGEIIDRICHRIDAPDSSIFEDAASLATFIRQVRDLVHQDLLSQFFRDNGLDEDFARRARNTLRRPRVYSLAEEDDLVGPLLLLGHRYPMQGRYASEITDFLRLEEYVNEPNRVLPALLEGQVIPTSELKHRPPEEQSFVQFSMMMRLVLPHRAFCTTDRGLVGAGPSTMMEGDVIAFLHGFAIPVVLRPKEGEDGYEFLEECYVHGLMRGRERWPRGVEAEEKIISIR